MILCSWKKSGNNYKGFNPFTNEKTPIFMVSPVKQIWKRISSGKEATWWPSWWNTNILPILRPLSTWPRNTESRIEETQQTDEEKDEANERESLYLINASLPGIFNESLTDTDSGKAIGLTHFKERGFTQKPFRNFSLDMPWMRGMPYFEALKKGYQLFIWKKPDWPLLKAINSSIGSKDASFSDP